MMHERAIKVIKSKNVINCAGLWGDEIEKLKNSKNSGEIENSKSDFNIHPKKGQFLVYEKLPAGLIPEKIIVPVYDEMKQTKVKWGAPSRWSFRPILAWESTDTTNTRKTRPTLYFLISCLIH